MTTLEQVISRTLGHLTAQRTPRNKLATTVNSSATSIVTTYDLGTIQAGSRISIGLEDMFCWAVDPATKTLTVERGDGESVGAAHTAGDIIQVNPQHSRFDCLQAINEEIAELPGRGIYQMTPVDLTYIASQSGYDLTGSAGKFLELYELRFKQSGSSKYWPAISEYDVSIDMAAAEFPSTTAVFLYQGANAGLPVRARYKATLTQLGTTDEAQVVETVTGLSVGGVGILPYGAAARLVAGRAVRRAQFDSQGNTRRAEEATVQDVAVSATGLLRQRDAAVNAETARLSGLHPLRLGR